MPLAHLVGDHVERDQHRVALDLGDDADVSEAVDVGTRPGDVVGPQAPVERQALGVAPSARRPGPPSKRPCHSVLPPGGHPWGSGVGCSRLGALTPDPPELAQVAASAAHRSPRRRTSGCRRPRRCRASPAGSSGRAPTPRRGRSPGGVRSTTRWPARADLGHPLPHHPPQMVLAARCRAGSYSGIAYTVSPPGHPHLHRTEVVEVARHRRLGGRDALGGEQVDQLGLAGDGVLADQPARSSVAVGPWWSWSDSHQEGHRTPRAVCIRLWPCAITWRASAVDHLGGDLVALGRPAGSA